MGQNNQRRESGWQICDRHIGNVGQRSGRCSWAEESPDRLVDEPELECDEALEPVELDFASSFCDLYSEGMGK